MNHIFIYIYLTWPQTNWSYQNSSCIQRLEIVGSAIYILFLFLDFWYLILNLCMDHSSLTIISYAPGYHSTSDQWCFADGFCNWSLPNLHDSKLQKYKKHFINCKAVSKNCNSVILGNALHIVIFSVYLFVISNHLKIFRVV